MMGVLATIENGIIVRGWWWLLEYFSNGQSDGEALRRIIEGAGRNF